MTRPLWFAHMVLLLLGSNWDPICLKLADKLELNWFHVGGKAPRVSEMYIDGQ